MAKTAPDAAALGRAVQAIRAEQGMTQMQLVEATGFMQAWISNMENGRRNASWSNVGRLAEGLGVTVAELASRAEALQQE
jgi:transcriptional regulator with XRE-family HTH domain